MMGEDKPSPPDGTLVAADDSAAAGSTGITITRFRHPIMAIPDFGRNRNVADKITLLGKLPCGKAIWPATSSEILSLLAARSISARSISARRPKREADRRGRRPALAHAG
jgi:hypothetical protein